MRRKRGRRCSWGLDPWDGRAPLSVKTLAMGITETQIQLGLFKKRTEKEYPRELGRRVMELIYPDCG